MVGKGVGYGKVILFGEHFVVHGAPAIAAGISNAAVVEVKTAKRNSIVTEQKVVPELSLAAIQNVLSSMGVKECYEVMLEGDLHTFGGLGSSAAFCVALARAVADARGIHPSEEEINGHAYNGEKAFHGNPSGIDNLMATYGGVMEFTRGATSAENRFGMIALKKPLDLAVSFTGKFGLTPKMIEAVAKFRDSDRDGFEQLKDEYLDIEENGKKALMKGQTDVIGKLMNANQTLLQELGVSDELNDEIVKRAMDYGALGSKLTGGGGGGCCISLGKDKDHAKELSDGLSKAGFQSFSTRVGR